MRKVTSLLLAALVIAAPTLAAEQDGRFQLFSAPGNEWHDAQQAHELVKIDTLTGKSWRLVFIKGDEQSWVAIGNAKRSDLTLPEDSASPPDK